MRRKNRGRHFARWIIAAALLLAAGWFWLQPKFSSTPPAGKRVASGVSSTSPILHSNPMTEPHSVTSAVISVTTSPSIPARVETNRSPAIKQSQPPRSTVFTPGTNDLAINTNTYPRPVLSVFEMQVALARLGVSPGSIDGQVGGQTRSALRAFQQREHLPSSVELDQATREKLLLEAPPIRTYTVGSNDLSRLQPVSPTWLGKSQQTALDYETILELLAETSKSSPQLIRRLNPAVKWDQVAACQTVSIPDITYPRIDSHAAFLSISLSEKVLEAWDEQTNLLVHFPCSIARQVEKRPVGELHVAVIAPHPNYTFDPSIFPESIEANELKTKLVLPPGPNNPVGVAWIGLDKPGYGIHGTPSPEQVGRTESHGCFRLANWNAEYLLALVEIGTPVYVRP